MACDILFLSHNSSLLITVSAQLHLQYAARYALPFVDFVEPGCGSDVPISAKYEAHRFLFGSWLQLDLMRNLLKQLRN